MMQLVIHKNTFLALIGAVAVAILSFPLALTLSGFLAKMLTETLEGLLAGLSIGLVCSVALTVALFIFAFKRMNRPPGSSLNPSVPMDPSVGAKAI